MRYFLSLLFAAFLGSGLNAHELRPGYLEIEEISSETYQVLWKVPAKNTNLKLGLEFRLPADCQVISPASSRYLNSAFVERSTVRKPGGMEGSEVYIEGLARTYTDVLLRYQSLDGSVQTARLTPENPSFTVEEAPSSLAVAKTYTILGIEHIWKGIDHLLFVVCLMFVADSRRKLIATITGFTVAHSITLVLSTLNFVRLPVAPVEAVIALSIVFVAVEICRGDRKSLTYQYPMLVSSSFGLLHGFGFASVLNQIGLPEQEVPVSLLFFNVGVEIGQILFVLAALLLFFCLFRIIPSLKGKATVLFMEKSAAYVIGALAAYWTIQRIAGFWV